jgi:ribose transport system substrate-binding protein
MKRTLRNGLIVVLVLTLAAAAFAGGVKETGELNLVILYKGVHPWYDPCGEGFAEAAKAVGGITTRVAAPTTWSGEAQAKMMEDLIAEGVDGIAIAVYDVDALTPVIDEAMKQGIPVIAYDADAPKSKQIMFIGTDNPAAGVQQGEAFAKQMGGKGEYVIFVQDLVSANVKQRVDGIRSVLKRYPDMKEIMSEQNYQYTMANAVQLAENILNANPNIKGAVDTGMEGAGGMHTVLKERGYPAGGVKLIPWTTLPFILEGVKEGYITGTMRQNPYAMGYLSLYGLKYWIEGKKPSQKFFDSGIVLATRENVDTIDDVNKQKTPAMLEEFKKLWK